MNNIVRLQPFDWLAHLTQIYLLLLQVWLLFSALHLQRKLERAQTGPDTGTQTTQRWRLLSHSAGV